MATNDSSFTWQFQRLGGLDHVTLRSGEELAHLDELNPKLWAALSCPAVGLEFDSRTLSLLDLDADGRIRMPEILAALDWLKPRLKDLSSIVDAPEDLPLDVISEESDEGQRLLATAKSVLRARDLPRKDRLDYATLAEALAHAEENIFNGDGIIPPRPEFSPEVVAFIEDAIALIGAEKDAGGSPGINESIARAFARSLESWQLWRDSVDSAGTPLGNATAEAWKLLQELAPKVEDYFTRCEMAAFAPWSCQPPKEEELPLGLQADMSAGKLEELPLARVEPDRPLSLSKSVNPAWRKRVERFAELAAPLIKDPEHVTRKDWEALLKNFSPYQAALDKKPEAEAVEPGIAPTAKFGDLDTDRLVAHLEQNTLSKVLELTAKDAAAPAIATDLPDLERLLLYHTHLHRLLMNFVSFFDFYSLLKPATFQYGTLYLDERSCALCLPVADVAAHAALAARSNLFLVYCSCRRAGKNPGDAAATMTIVGAVTAGTIGTLVEGRNGIFFDSSGRDWDATVVKVIANPISIKEAAWEPYRRVARVIAEQVSKFAATKQAEAISSLNAKVSTAATPAKTAQPFDLGKSMGIFAAIGLALGALGTALASIAKAVFSLAWWQIPLVFLIILLLISGPSMLLAWLKLRKRSLGPLLEASGWAVNSLSPINLALGAKLTDTAHLPPNATRRFNDPLHKSRRWPALLALLVGAVFAVGAVLLWQNWAALPLPWK